MPLPESLFTLANLAVLPAWALLVLAPRWRWSSRLFAPVVMPALLSLVYLYVLATHWPRVQNAFGSLADVRHLFDDPALLLAGWLHYLAFDLFIGSWEVRNAQRLGLPHWVVVPCLLLTLFFGPLGLLSYLVVRGGVGRRLWIDEDLRPSPEE